MTTSITQAERPRNRTEYLLVALIWLALWELLALIINEEVLFVSPHKVLVALIRLGGTLPFWQTIFLSILRVLGGFVLGYLLSALLAALAFRFSFLKAFLSPAISVIKAPPVASFIILALMWSGKNFVPVIICILMVAPIVWSNVLEGLAAVDGDLLEMAQVYGMSPAARIRSIYVPSLIPYNAAAVGSGLGLCWKAGIAAEVICRTLPSIGNSIWETKFYIITDEMFAWTATVVILSVIFDRLIKFFMGRLLKKYKTEVAQ